LKRPREKVSRCVFTILHLDKSRDANFPHLTDAKNGCPVVLKRTRKKSEERTDIGTDMFYVQKNQIDSKKHPLWRLLNGRLQKFEQTRKNGKQVFTSVPQVGFLVFGFATFEVTMLLFSHFSLVVSNTRTLKMFKRCYMPVENIIYAINLTGKYSLCPEIIYNLLSLLSEKMVLLYNVREHHFSGQKRGQMYTLFPDSGSNHFRIYKCII
jgi:hypothetical protein